jgi:ABC-2 type transport system ATP-binding protein
MTERPVAVLEGVSKRLGHAQALDGFDLRLSRGEILGVLGPNGAGKTTALSILVGLRRPDHGRALLFGIDPRNPRSRRSVGVTPQNVSMPTQLRVSEVLDFVRAHYPDPIPVAELLEMFCLSGLASRQIGGLSGGQLRRLANALAFAGRPEVLFLDEPTTGLDVEARLGIWSVLRDFVNKGGTVLLTTHYLEEAEALATRVVVMDRGRALAEGSVAAITGRVGIGRISFNAQNPPALHEGCLVAREGDRFTVTTRDTDRAIREIALSCDFHGLQLHPVTLEEAFRWLVREPHQA